MNSALRFTVSRGLATSQQVTKGVRLAPTAQEQVDKWIHTNKVDVKRPMSPHLSVYKWSVPMSISGAYRVTSVFPLSAAVLLTPLVYSALKQWKESEFGFISKAGFQGFLGGFP